MSVGEGKQIIIAAGKAKAALEAYEWLVKEERRSGPPA